MDEVDLSERLGPEFAAAFAERGFTSLTPVQEAALAPEVKDCDLRITSQTGSGKTLAIGFAIRELMSGDSSPINGAARPAALVIAPTRELAKQVEEELAWLFKAVGKKVASVTGGSDFRQERRGLSSGPSIIVGTPGRLLDQLNRGSIDSSQVRAVALDEADRMLDMGFRDDIEAIFAKTPEGRRTHLVSATFPREVVALANKMQKNPIMIEGTPLGAANADIDHVIHLVLQNERLDAIVNLLLASPGAQTLVFARTRADVADLTAALADEGFHVSALSGEMEQRERNRALAAFKTGDLDAMIATDVAARGIDVNDIARVIHAEPPTDADSYTHRSGRTGRAGKKGQSTLLVSPAGLNRATFLLRRAGVRARVEPLPTPEAILDARDALVVADLTTEDGTMAVPDERTLAIARKVIEGGGGERAIARLLAQRFTRRTEPRKITPVTAGQRDTRHERIDRSRDRNPLREQRSEGRPHFSERDRSAGPRAEGAPFDPARRNPSRPPPGPGDSWVPFRVSWGEAHGADARRLLAMACRRGGIEGTDIGAIRVFRNYSQIDVSNRVAESFIAQAGRPDPRDPRVTISADDGPPRPQGAVSAPPPRAPAADPAPQAAAAPPREAPKASPSRRGASARVEEAPPREAPKASPSRRGASARVEEAPQRSAKIPSPASEARPARKIVRLYEEKPLPRGRGPKPAGKPGFSKAPGKPGPKPAGKTFGKPTGPKRKKP